MFVLVFFGGEDASCVEMHGIWGVIAAAEFTPTRKIQQKKKPAIPANGQLEKACGGPNL